MGICFVGKRKNFDDFMDQYIEEKPGKIVAMDGKFLRLHRGIHHFTLGKRLRFTSGTHLGYYVSKINYDTNEVTVVGFYLFFNSFCIV